MSGAEITITFLGTGSAIPPNSRQQVSFTLRHSSGLCIFDCGEGTQYALRKMGISTRKQLILIISHLHSDHFLGLPGLLSSFQLLGREEEIVILGPQGTFQTVQNIINAFYVKCEYPLKVHEMAPHSSYKGEGFIITAFKSKHEANALSFVWEENDFPGKVDKAKVDALGIPEGPLIGKLQHGENIEFNGVTIRSSDVVGPIRKGRVVIYTGDTAYNQEFADSIPKNADLLIHEATYPSDNTELAKERNHTTFDQAAKIAAICTPAQLVLTHISPRVLNFEKEILLARRIFANTVVAKDGMELTIPYPY